MTRPKVAFKTGVNVDGSDLADVLSCAHFDLRESCMAMGLMGLDEEAEECERLAKEVLALMKRVKDRTEGSE